MKNVEHLSYVAKTRFVPCVETIPQILRRQAEKIPDKTLFTIYHEHKLEGSITFGELYSQCRKFASALSSIGINKGDVIVVCLRNSVDWLIIEYGICLLGAIPLNSDIQRDDFSDVQYVIEQSSAKALVFHGDCDKTVSYIAEMMKAASQEKPSLQYAICVSSNRHQGVLNFYEMMEAPGTLFDVDSVYIDMDDPALILRSGTTGRPKLILHSHCTFLSPFTQKSNKEQSTNTVDTSVRFTNSHFGWVGGCPLVDILRCGSGISYTGENMAAHVDQILECARKEKATLFTVTAPILNAIIKLQDLSDFPDTIKMFTIGGSPIKSEYQTLLRRVPMARAAYGCLEICMISTIIMKKGDQIVSNASGYVANGAEIKVCDDQMKIVERRVTGRIYARHPFRFLGYYGDNELTKQSVSNSNWYDTEDVGYIDHEGQLFVIGRQGDTISHGTETTHCNEIENLVKDAKIPEIYDVVVVPIGDEIYGQNNCYCVQLKDGVNVTVNELKEKVCERITADYYRPHDMIFVDRFCYNANGKVERKALTKLAATR